MKYSLQQWRLSLKLMFRRIASSWLELKQWHSTRDLWIGIIIPSLFVNILMLAFPLALLQTYDRIIPNASMQTLIILIIGIVAIIIIEIILRMLRAMISNWAFAREEYLTSTKLLNHMLNVSMSFYDDKKKGSRLEYTSIINKFKDLYGGQVLINLLDLIFVVVFLLLIAYIAGIFVLIPIVMLAVLGIYSFRSSIRLENSLEIRKENNDRRTDFIIDALTGVRTLKSMAMEGMMMRRYERLQFKSADVNYDIGMTTAQNMAVVSNLSQLTLALVVGFGSILVIHDQLTVGGLAACTLLSSRVLQPVANAIGLWNKLRDSKVSENALAKVTDIPVENLNPDGLRRIIKGKIQFQNVSYSRSSGAKVVEKLSLDIEPNTTVVFTGDNRQGISTLFRLIMKFIDPSSGTVLIDNVALNKYDLRNLRKQIVYIPQDGVLYAGTILDNITTFRPELEVKARRIAAKLGLNRAIAQFPSGLDTEIGYSSNELLPNGLRQLVSFARALIDEPKIILFDKATSSIDKNAEKVINSALRQYRREFTLLMVTDKQSLHGLADKIYDYNFDGLKEVSID